MKLWRLFWQLMTASLLSACVMPVAQHGGGAGNVPSRHVGAAGCRGTETFAFSARFALTLAARAQEKTPRQLSGRLEWRRDTAGETLFIADPFGRGIATLHREQTGAFVLQQADGVEQSSNDPQALLEETLGVPLPLAELAAWVCACPNSGALVETDAAGRPTRARESGWLLAWRYADTSAERPSRFDASLESVLKLRLAFEHWMESPPEPASQDAP